MQTRFTVRTAVCMCLLLAGPLLAEQERLRILESSYPRVFYFRATERACSPQAYPSYESWERDFGGLMGIMGKCLEEECLGREPRAPEFFTRFKQRHPEQAVLLHFNGNSRDPLYHREAYFPGHWVYRKAVAITADVPATPGETVIHVSDASDFRVNTGRYRTSNDDIALFGLKDGKHDWYHCEHVQLVSVDKGASTITVKRGCYGSKPLAFREGEARAAAHQAEGPWGQNNHLLWYYNYSTHCPKDRNGKACSDLLVEDLATWLGEGGVLQAYDGIEFDVLFNVTHGDTDGDGEVDNGVLEGRNNYGIGVIEFAKKLRARMGPDFIIQADGALGSGGERSQRAFGILNGIESEGWPNLNDWEIDDWSGGLNRHFFWQQNAHLPAFSYINHKWVAPVPDQPGHHRSVAVPFSRHRLAFAAAQFFDSMICYSSTPKLPPSTGYTFWTREVNVPAGATLEFSLGMGALSPERSDGVWFQVHAAELVDGKTGTYKQLFEQTSKEYKWLPQSVSLKAYAGKTMRLKFVADCGPEDNSVTDQASWGDVRIESPTGTQRLVSKQRPTVGMCIRNQPETAIDPKTGAHVTYTDGLDIGGKSLPAYSTHPPYRRLAKFTKFPIWDEFVRGEDNVLGWLGRPEAPAVHLAVATPDLLEGRGRGSDLAQKISGQVTASAEGESVVIRPANAQAKRVRFTLADLPTRGSDLFVSVTMKGNAMAGCPREMARFARVGVSGGIVDLVGGEAPETGMCLRGGQEEPLDRATGARVTRGPIVIAGVKLPTYFVHPPYKGGIGYTYWTRDVQIPADSELRFSLGMGALSPERSDGVWFSVHAEPLSDDGTPGPETKLFEKSTKAHEWLPQTVPLGDYAGKRVRLKFVADPGPANNATTDHAHWGDVKIVPAGAKESDLTKSVQYMTWLNDKPFTSTFYFRHVNTKFVDLSFNIESPEPIEILSLTAHAHPDAMYRVFEKGIVLANPSRVPYTFHLASLSPGRTYRRLKATRFQDGQANSGQPVGGKVTLGERDALFLVKNRS